MTRQKKTPRARAEEALGVAQRKVKRLEDEAAKHAEALKATETELAAAKKRLEYVAANPDLPGEGERQVEAALLTRSSSPA